MKLSKKIVCRKNYSKNNILNVYYTKSLEATFTLLLPVEKLILK